MTAKEIWLTTKHNINYEVSNYGNIRNLKTKRILKPSISNKGYYMISLSNKSHAHTYTIHKLVLEHFKLCKSKDMVCNHIDGDKLNNNINNLEWTTQKYNINHAWNNKRCENIVNSAKINIIKAFSSKMKSVNQFDNNENLINRFISIRNAELVTGIDNGAISKCCNNKRKSAGGYIWKYSND